MKIVILGAGALGTVLGAHLTRAGEEVSLIARGNRAAYLQEHGATLTGLVDFTVPISVVTDPHRLLQADALIVTVKTYDTATALAHVKHLQVGSVMSVQNGVLKNEQLADTFGWEKVLGAMAAFSAEVLPDGPVRFTVNEGFYIGELPTGLSERVYTLGHIFESAGIVAQVTPSIQTFEWSKYVLFVCLMAPAVLTRLETYKFLQDPHTAAITASLIHEMAAIAAARQIELEDTAYLAVKTLSQLSLDDMIVPIGQRGAQFAAQAPTHKVSTLQDLEQGKRCLEVEETLGYAVQQGAALGVPTPTLHTCYRLIAGINRSLQ
jgi:2-dehydropantoate 2-reductase